MSKKEQVYDSKINLLMTEIIRICKEHKIAVLANFVLEPVGDEYPDGLQVTTALLAAEYQPTEAQIKAYKLIYDGMMSYAAFTITTKTKDDSNV